MGGRLVLGPSEARVFVGGNYSSAVVHMMGRGAECVEVRALEPEELPAGLPTGWKVEVWVRKNGATAGARDMYYRNPMVRRKFRSKEEIIRYFALGKAKKRFSNECAVKNSSPELVDPSAGNKFYSKNQAVSSHLQTGEEKHRTCTPKKRKWSGIMSDETLTLNHEHRLINSQTRRCHFGNNFLMGLTTLDVQRFTTAAHATILNPQSITHGGTFQEESPTFQFAGQPKPSHKQLLEYGDNFKQNVKSMVDENEVNVGFQSYNHFNSVLPWDLANEKQSNMNYPKAVDTESIKKMTSYRCFEESFMQLVTQSNGQPKDASEISLGHQQVFEVIDGQISSKYDPSQYLGNGWLHSSDKDEGKGVTKESSNLEFPLGESSWGPCLKFAVKILKGRIPLPYYDLHAWAASEVEP